MLRTCALCLALVCRTAASSVVDGVRAKNTVVRRFEGVTKPDYHLVEQAEDAFEPDDSAVAVVDMRLLHGSAEDRQKFVAALGGSLRTIGFAVLVGHGVDEELHARAPHEVESFFTRHSLSTKRRFNARRKGSVNQGYFGVAETSNLQPDMVEGWVFCRRAFGLDGGDEAGADALWPDGARDREFFSSLVAAHQPLVQPLAAAILESLGCEPHLLDAALERPAFGLRLNYYPPCSHADLESGAGRMLGHEDMDLFTLLPSPSQDGLQVRNPVSGRWIRLHPPPGSIILNVGDYLQRITNDVLPSTTHRVAAPAADDPRRGVARTSTPLAVYLAEHELLSVLPGLGEPKYDDISAIDFHVGVMSKYYGADYRQSGED